MEVIHEYIRERQPGRGKQIVGVIAGTVIEGMICIGWSKCNWKEGDVFDKQEGIDRAMSRARGVDETPELPIQLNRQMREFQTRCIRYFKQASVLSLKGPHVEKVLNSEVEGVMSMINQVMGQLGAVGGIGIVGGSDAELKAFAEFLGDGELQGMFDLLNR
jgi:hypothetical protein